MSKNKNVNKETGEVINEKKTAGGLFYRPKSGWKLELRDMEKIEGPSMTVQKQAFSVRDLLSKSSRGINVVIPQAAVNYGEDIDGTDYHQLAQSDIFEREEFTKEAVRKVMETKEKVEAATKAKRKKETEPQPKDPE